MFLKYPIEWSAITGSLVFFIPQESKNTMLNYRWSSESNEVENVQIRYKLACYHQALKNEPKLSLIKTFGSRIYCSQTLNSFWRVKKHNKMVHEIAKILKVDRAQKRIVYI